MSKTGMFGKRILALVLTVTMLLTLTPTTALALSEAEGAQNEAAQGLAYTEDVATQSEPFTEDASDIQPLDDDDDDLILEGNCGDQGDNVTFRMTITDALKYEIFIRGSGAMANYLTTFPPWYHFRANISLVVIGEGVTVIGAGSFAGCKFISIDIPNTVTTIGDFALSSCTNLTSIFLRSNVTTIGEGAFTDCTGLTSFTIPNGVTSIATNTFQNCSNLRSISIPNGLSSIGVFAFTGCSRLSSVVIPYGVTSIGYYAFQDCSSLTSITIPYGVTSIANYVFRGCDSLSSVTLPSTVTTIGIEAFKNCTSLSSISLPNTVTTIGEGAFTGCTELTGTLTIPANVTRIGYGAFQDCTGITTLVFGGSASGVDSNAFNGVRNTGTLYYPTGATGYQAGVFCSPALDGWSRVASSLTTPAITQNPAASTPTPGSSTLPQTGDSNNIVGWLAALILLAVWVAGALAWRRQGRATGRQ